MEDHEFERQRVIILSIMNTLKEEGHTVVWIDKEYVKLLKKTVKEKYPHAKIEKLSGSEVHHLFISVTKK